MFLTILIWVVCIVASGVVLVLAAGHVGEPGDPWRPTAMAAWTYILLWLAVLIAAVLWVLVTAARAVF